MKFLLPLPVVILVSVLLWFGFGRNPSTVPNPLVGRPAPAFALDTTTGTGLSLSRFHGRPIVLNFFASWCTTCRAEESNLVQAYRRWGRRVTFLAIVYEDSPELAAGFARSYGARWPDLVDKHSSTAIAYGISGIPTTFFINSRGLITGYTYSLLPASLNTGIQKAM